MEPDREKESKKKRCKPEEDRSTSGMESLPPEVTLDILSRLPISSLIQCKFVCRPWCNLAHDPRIANTHLCCAGENDPCLIFHSDYPIQNQLCFVDIDSHNGYQETIKKFNIPFRSLMPEFNLVGSCNGFLCLSNSLFDNPQYIYNPFTREYKELPQVSNSSDLPVVFGFGFHPITKEYKVVRIVHQRFERCPPGLRPRHGCRFWNEKSRVQIFTLGTHAWRDLETTPYQLDGWASEASVNGSLHWLTQPLKNRGRVLYRSIVSFDLADEKFREVPRPQCGALNMCNYHLVVLKGYLSAVVYCKNEDLEIWMMKDYNVSESWTKEFTIRAYVPVGLKQDVDPPIHYGIDRTNRIKVRVVCILKTGEVLIEFKGRSLVSYHPDREEFKDLTFHGLPKRFQTVIHVGSLISIDATDGIQRG